MLEECVSYLFYLFMEVYESWV